MDVNDYQPRQAENAEFMNTEERREKYMQEHGLYLENKKEQQERMQLYYILEQFHEKAQRAPDTGSDA